MRLTSSMQPISTRRCPCSGSRPVVSVSNTISRIDVLCCESASSSRHCSNCVKDSTHLGTGGVKALRRIHYEIGAPALLRVRHLLGKDDLKLFQRHSRPLEHTSLLHLRRGRGNDHRIDALFTAGLE